MDDIVTTNMILIISDGTSTDLQVYVENKVATTLAAGRLAKIIANAMKLAEDDEYDLYVKLPKDATIGSLGIETVPGIALIATTAGQIPFTPGKQKKPNE